MMSNFEKLWSLPPLAWILLVTTFMATLGAGTLWIAVFHKSFFLSVSTDKICLLSFSFTVPLWALNSILFWCIKPKFSLDNIHQILTWGAIFTCFILDMLVLMGYRGVVNEGGTFLYFLLFELVYSLASYCLPSWLKKKQ